MMRAHSTLLLTVLLLGCRAPSASVHSDTTLMQRTELFFGLSLPNGSEISDAMWQTFVDDEITPRFPDGFTVLDGAGQWRESSGKISHERSKILLILCPRDVATTGKLDEIRAAYKKRFNQVSVIRESGDAWVSF